MLDRGGELGLLSATVAAVVHRPAVRRSLPISALLGAVLFGACRDRPSPPGSTAVPQAGSAASAADAVARPALPPRGGEVTLVTDADALAALEARGFSFGARFAHVQGESGAVLATSARYASLVEWIRSDLDELLAGYAEGRPSIGTSKKTAREIDPKWALFNRAWLTSAALRYELVGVVNRFDRRVLSPYAATCGEIRLIYRAAYAGPREGSRLPLTIVVVHPNVSSDCGVAARAWLSPDGVVPKGPALADWLANGPLRAIAEGRSAPVRFELDVLVEMWSRFVQGFMGPGSHHRYSLRVFVPEGERLRPAPLDNTPDVAAVLASKEKKKALLAWIVEQRRAIDEGRAALPALPLVGEVRATKVSSVTAMGLTRAANRPFSRIFADDLTTFRGALGLASDGEARALLRKLDMLTCNGCHVTRSVLGLHLLGEERDAAAYRDPAAHAADPAFAVDLDTKDRHPHDAGGELRKDAPLEARVVVNRLAVPVSPHLHDESARRADDLRRYLEAGAPTNLLAPGSFVPMPPADRGASKGVYGAPCALDEPSVVGPDRADLACRSGLRCAPIDGSGYGQCVGIYGDPSKDLRAVGDPFEIQKYSVGAGDLWARADAAADFGPLARALPCIGGGPTGREMGFPFGGVCAPTVQRLVVDLVAEGHSTACPASDGPVPLGESAYVTASGAIQKARVEGGREVVCTFEPFRAADTWGFMSTAAMVWNSTAPAFLQACDLDRPCRDEYVCMRRPVRANASLRDPHQGACVAGYVLAQLEIDAHKVP